MHEFGAETLVKMTKFFADKNNFKMILYEKLYIFTHIGSDLWSIKILENDRLAQVTLLNNGDGNVI